MYLHAYDEAQQRWVPVTPAMLAGGGGGGGGGDASAANQALQIAAATTTNARLGDLSDAPPGSDTAAASIAGRLVRIAQRLTSLIAALPTLVLGRSLTEPLGQPSVARQQTVTTISASVTLTTTCRRVSIKARSCDQRFVVGTGSLTADASTSHYIEAGERLDVAVPASGVIAVIRAATATSDGRLEITELV